MSNNHISSNEFATLCQSQLALLSQSLGAMWSVVYLSEEISEDGQSQVFPFAIYPQAQAKRFFELPPIKLSEIWQALQTHSISQFLPDNLTSENTTANSGDSWTLKQAETQHQIVPLIHQETLIGLLVTGRDDREWQQSELQQVEEIARTIAIARFLEFQYCWAENELTAQKNLRRIEHDRLDNLLHQLRNPLTALRTFSKLLLKRMLLDDPNSKLAQSILAQSDRFQGLLKQFEAEANKLPIVDSSIETNSSSFLLETGNNGVDQSSFLLPSSPSRLDSVDLNEILNPLLCTAKAIAVEKRIKLINNLPVKIPEVKADLTAVREALNNLIDNAFKYTPSGGIVQLDLESKNLAGMLGVAIKDTGCGIPLADQNQIFTRHYRGVQAQGDIPGTGLGLAIAQELTTKMQGKIELISPNDLSENSPGTTFIIWLPLSVSK